MVCVSVLAITLPTYLLKAEYYFHQCMQSYSIDWLWQNYSSIQKTLQSHNTTNQLAHNTNNHLESPVLQNLFNGYHFIVLL